MPAIYASYERKLVIKSKRPVIINETPQPYFTPIIINNKGKTIDIKVVTSDSERPIS